MGPLQKGRHRATAGLWSGRPPGRQAHGAGSDGPHQEAAHGGRGRPAAVLNDMVWLRQVFLHASAARGIDAPLQVLDRARLKRAAHAGARLRGRASSVADKTALNSSESSAWSKFHPLRETGVMVARCK